MESSVISGSYARLAQAYAPPILEGSLLLVGALTVAGKIDALLKSHFKGIMLGKLGTQELPLTAALLSSSWFMAKTELISPTKSLQIAALTIGGLACSYYRHYQNHVRQIQEIKQFLKSETGVSKKQFKIELEGFPPIDVIAISNPGKNNLLIVTSRSFRQSKEEIIFLSGHIRKNAAKQYETMPQRFFQVLKKGGALPPGILRPTWGSIPASNNLFQFTLVKQEILQDQAVVKKLDLKNIGYDHNVMINNSPYNLWFINNPYEDLLEVVITTPTDERKISLFNDNNILMCSSPVGYHAISEEELQALQTGIRCWCHENNLPRNTSIKFMEANGSLVSVFAIRHKMGNSPNVPLVYQKEQIE